MIIIISKEREYVFDNLKALLIILVVFGHVIELFELEGVFLKIKGIIYVFHMPLFVFISGYFSKRTNNIENKTIKNILIPFFIFNTLYMLTIEDGQYINIFDKLKNINIFRASYLYWYLLSLFFWKTFSKYIEKFKLSMILLFLLSLYIGIIKDANRFLAIGRTIAFFPFFMLGYYTKKDDIKKIRSLNKLTMVSLFIILIAITYVLSDNIIYVELFKNAQKYNTYVGVTNIKGIIIRVYQFIVSIAISICLINLISDKNNFIARLGQKTISVYILSPFVQKIFFLIVKNKIPIIIENNFLILITCIVITYMVVTICSLDIVNNTYNRIINWIYGKITINNKKMIEDKK